jgi:hypothetical protein
VELALNLVWAVAAICLLSTTYTGVRRGAVRLSMTSAMMLGLLLCFILLPAISMSDDLLASRQAALPLAAQSWRIAQDDATAGLDLALAMAACLLLLVCLQVESRRGEDGSAGCRVFSDWLVQAQRLRPPPVAA